MTRTSTPLRNTLQKGMYFRPYRLNPMRQKQIWMHLSFFSRLSRTCPASYQYLIKTPSYELIGASPETLIKVHSRKIQSKPIAGTVKLTEDNDAG